MLVLTRKPGEEIVFNHNIRLLIVSTPGGFVRVGIDSPEVLDDDSRVNTLHGNHIDLDESPEDYVNLFPEQPDTEEKTAVLQNVDILTAKECV
ncbi:carbon storage regulator [Zavarzinella formosa]|uniref:carbon storage regulator n=1 Tax=Zavarzinella formosa TaxID=360055 RepID=UPI0002E6F40A|nr:carbon storage regulator [Zavarzinella formosa]